MNGIRNCIFFALISLPIFLSTIRAPMVYIQFKIDQQKIYKNFCRNYDKPITACGGRCYLRKHLNHDATNGNQTENNKTQQVELSLFFEQVQPILFDSGETLFNFRALNDTYTSRDPDLPFKPPMV